MISFGGRQTTVRFSDTVPPDSTRTYSRAIEEPATAEQLSVRFYQGPELELEIRPLRQRESDALPLIDLVGRDVVVGDDDVFDFEVSEPLEEGDELVMEVTNNSTEYAYDFNADVAIDYLGGTERAVVAIAEGL